MKILDGNQPAKRSKLLGRAIAVVLPTALILALGPLIGFLINTEYWFVVPVLIVGTLVGTLFVGDPFIGIIIWLFVDPFVVNTSSVVVRYMFWMVHRALPILSLIGVLAFNWVHKRKIRPPTLGPPEVCMVIYILYIVASIFVRDTGNIGNKLVQVWDITLVPYALYLALRLMMPRSAEIKRLVPVLAVLCAVECVIGLTAWFFPDLLPSRWLTKQASRTTGTFVEPAEFNITLTLAVFILIHYAATRHRGLVRNLIIGICALGIGCILFAFSRTSWFGILGCTICLLFLYPKLTPRILVILAIIAILLGPALAPYIDYAVKRMHDTESTEGRDVGTRLMLALVAAKPLLGWGYGDYQVYYWEFATAPDLAIGRISSHNTYLTVTAELGFVGLVLCIFPILWWFINSIKVARQWQPSDNFWDKRLLVTLWLVAAFNILVTSFIDMRFFPFGMSILWFTLGLIASVIDSQQQAGQIVASKLY